jgi:diguanylate cyclase (GGDEF)-like protein
MFFSRRLSDAEGNFAGVALVGVKLAYFQHLYNSITSLRNQSFLFLRRDGTVLIRHPDPQMRSGERLPPGSPWYPVAEKGGGTFRTHGVFDGVARLVAVRMLKDYPLVINVATAEAGALDVWSRRATMIGVGTSIAFLCALFLLYGLSVHVRRLVKSEASLAEREAHLAEKTQQLARSNAILDSALHEMSQGLAMFDREERLIICNERYLQMYSLCPQDVRPGVALEDILHLRQRAGNFVADVQQYLDERRQRMSRGETVRIVTRLGDGRTMAVTNRPTYNGGWIATHEDITARERVEARMAYMARHDALTDLANRNWFRERLDDTIDRIRANGGEFSVLILDLDMFKAVNDSLGHPIGDRLLKQVADRLHHIIGDRDLIGRLGGDEFAIIHSCAGAAHASATILANRILSAIAAPYYIDGNEIAIGTSIGIATAPQDGLDADDLLKNADLALYRAKSEGRAAYRCFEAGMDSEMKQRRELELDLRHALSRDELEIHYQPVIDASTRKPDGVEALIRWRHPTRGLISPDKFIPLAEETGLIAPIGEWILRHACREATRWPDHIRLAVNLSPVQFRSQDLATIVREALAHSGLPARRLELEITESVLLQKTANALGTLHQLKTLGVGIVLDDFGTGYSSLSYLRVFPFDKIKIDRSFIAEMQTSHDCAAIVAAITGLARTLDVETTAEGVETEDQFLLLRATGCTHAQGYLFSRPVPADKLPFRDVLQDAVA